jgi:poly(3-hydroxybutyrate) depolymerase
MQSATDCPSVLAPTQPRPTLGAQALSSPKERAGPSRDGRCSFGIDSVTIGDRRIAVVEHERIMLDFGVLTEFVRGGTDRRVLVVAPLGGAYPVLLRDLVLGLLRHANVAVTDWRDPLYVPAATGDFGLAENVVHVLTMMQAIGPEVHVVGVCQGSVTALAAAALLSRIDAAATPQSLTLIAGPIDPLANPTRVVLAARLSGEWLAHSMQTVEDGMPGAGRQIYPASAQLITLTTYLTRHWFTGDVFWKIWQDDGEDPFRFPFSRLITQIMNLPAELVLDMAWQVFIEPALCKGWLQVQGQRISPSEIHSFGLLTVEGEKDDIAAPGQTYAGHALCTGIPKQLHRHLLVPSAGHFSLFHGARWRSSVCPALVQFFEDTEAARLSQRQRRRVKSHAGAAGNRVTTHERENLGAHAQPPRKKVV